jgi:hypothetical protein
MFRREKVPVRSRLLVLLLGLALLVAGCAKPTPLPTQLPNTGGQPVPLQGHPDAGYAGFVAALKAQGADVQPTGLAATPYFEVEGQVLRVNGVDIQVFQFQDIASRQAASQTIARDASRIGSTAIATKATPHFWAKDRLIVFYNGENQAIINLLTKVLGQPVADGNFSK